MNFSRLDAISVATGAIALIAVLAMVAAFPDHLVARAALGLIVLGCMVTLVARHVSSPETVESPGDELSDVVAALPGIVMAFDDRGSLIAETEGSKALRETLGLSDAGAPERSELLSRLPSAVREARQEPRTVRAEFNGRRFDLEVSRPSTEAHPEGCLAVSWSEVADDSALREALAFAKAVDRTQATIEFDLEGNILDANENFLVALGYTRDEVIGQHHRIFCNRAYTSSTEYKNFWAKLARGEYDAGKYRRIAKDGSEIWIQAAYNPVFDDAGNPVRVVKIATDITAAEANAREAALKGSAFSIASKAITVLDGDKRIVFANQAASLLFSAHRDEIAAAWKGFDAEQLIGQVLPLEDDVFGEDRIGLDIGAKKFRVVLNALNTEEYQGHVLEWTDVTEATVREGLLKAFDETQALIEFSLDGTIENANAVFLETMGYRTDEVIGQHHSIFAHEGVAESREYKEFWAALRRGEPQTGRFKRLSKTDQDVWLQASYIPILDENGTPYRVVKTATDVTADEEQAIEQRAIFSAIDRTQGKIEFDLSGIILSANDAFLEAVGYSRDELVGQHHSKLCDAEYASSREYAEFWERLGRGEFDAGKYRRVAKGGREIWIQAAYNPVLDSDGQAVRVIKFATDITAAEREAVDRRAVLNAVDRSQAVIEFDLDGRILDANENFLSTVGYSLEEIRGQHHRIFCEEAYAESEAYREFWQKLRSGSYDAGVYKRLGKDGREVWIQAAYNPILNDRGEPVRVVKFATDITASKLLAREATYKSAAFSGSSVAMLMIDRDHKVQYVNASLEALFTEHEATFAQEFAGFDPKALIGKPVDSFHNDARNLKSTIADPENLPFTSDLTIGDLKISLSVSGVFDEDGGYVGNVLEWKDVTIERTHASMIEAIGRTQALIEFTPKGEILDINDNFA